MKRKLELTPANAADIFRMLVMATSPVLARKVGIGTYRNLPTHESKNFLKGLFEALGLPAPVDGLTYEISIVIYPDNLASFGKVVDVGFLFYGRDFVSLGRVHITSEAFDASPHADTVELIVQNRRVFGRILDRVATVPMVHKMVLGVFNNEPKDGKFIMVRNNLSEGRNKFPRRAKLFQHRKKCGEYRVQVNLLVDFSKQEWLRLITRGPTLPDGASVRRIIDLAAVELGEVLIYDHVGTCQILKSTETQLDLRIQYLKQGTCDICYIYISFKDFDTEMMKSLQTCRAFTKGSIGAVMKRQAYVEECPGGWYVYTYAGGIEEALGPYRWKWQARLVCKLENSCISNKVL